MESKNVWLIINPKSGGGNALKQKKLILNKATEMGWQGKYGEATALNRGKVWAEKAALAGVKHFIIGGGDGTVRDVLRPVVEGKLTLGIIPLGTGNVLARNLDIPLDTEQAVRVALHGKVRHMDMGEANGNYFGVIASMGMDVDIMADTKKISKGRWGILAYVWTALKSKTKLGEKYRVVIDGNNSHTYWAKSIAVVNLARTVAGIEVAQGAGPQSGDLKVVIVSPFDLESWFNLLGNAIRSDVNKSPYYKLFKARKVEIYPLSGPKKYECDGDELPPTDKLEINFHPGALKVKVPTGNMSNRMVGEKRKVLIFDFDGTLADTLQTMVNVFNSLAERYNYPKVDNKQVEELRGQSAKEALKQLGIHKSSLPKLLSEGRKEFIRQQSNPEFFPGMKEVLLKLKDVYGLGIVTSNEAKNVDALLKRNEMQIFDFIYSDRSIFGKGKIFKRLMLKYGFTKEQLIYVGDEVRDIEAARESGIKVAAVGWGFNTKAVLMKNKPDWWINKPKDLTKLKF